VSLSSCEVLNPNNIVSPNPTWAWVVVSGLADSVGTLNRGGVGRVRFGFVHTLATYAWSLCTGGSEFPEASWPASGTGNDVTWVGDCYHVAANPVGATRIGVLVVPEDATGLIRLALDPRAGDARFYDCDGDVAEICSDLLGVGDATVGGVEGATACGQSCDVNPIEEASWGRVKAVYRD
jgi:hypothetical protein